MKELSYTNNTYQTVPQNRPLSLRLFPSFFFYLRFVKIIYDAAKLAKTGPYGDGPWCRSSYDVMCELERIGVKISISGIENVEKTEGPCVFIGNHMSMMETMLFPAIVLSRKSATFVIKESLLEYPVFKHIMRACNPIAVTRTNPRQDLKTVMQEGVNRLTNGRSVIVFPQTTRSHVFDPAQMSSIGVKLAKRAGVPVIPVALKTDCWTNGSVLKDFGRIDLDKTAHFSFGSALTVQGKGAEEQESVNNFISQRLANWSELD